MAGTMDDNEQEPALQTNSSMHPSKSIPQARIDSNQSRNDSVNAHDNGGVEKGRGSTQNHYGLSSTINHLSVEYDEGRDERNIYETNTKSQVLCLSGEEVDQTANAPWKSAQNDRSQECGQHHRRDESDGSHFLCSGSFGSFVEEFEELQDEILSPISRNVFGNYPSPKSTGIDTLSSLKNLIGDRMPELPPMNTTQLEPISNAHYRTSSPQNSINHQCGNNPETSSQVYLAQTPSLSPRRSIHPSHLHQQKTHPTSRQQSMHPSLLRHTVVIGMDNSKQKKKTSQRHQCEMGPGLLPSGCSSSMKEARSIPGGEGPVSNPIYVIRSSHQALSSFTYLLPCLRDSNSVSVNLDQNGHIRQFCDKARSPEQDSRDVLVAKRRVDSSVCLFGGTLNSTKNGPISIFRRKDCGSNKPQYDKLSSQRHNVTNGRISWDADSQVPGDIDELRPERHAFYSDVDESCELSRANLVSGAISQGTNKQRKLDTSSLSSLEDGKGSASKTKYRCKLCGQPKQNHKCTFRQSLQRNMGVQVYSAVNAYEACEPGVVAPPLTEMNNFVSYDSTHGSPQTIGEDALPRSARDQPIYTNSQYHASTITPQSMHDGATILINSPQSSLSTHSQDMSPHRDHAGLRHPAAGHYSSANSTHFNRSSAHFYPPRAYPHQYVCAYPQTYAYGYPNYGYSYGHHPQYHVGSHASAWERQYRPYSHTPFIPAVSLKSEQFRAVASLREETSSNTSPVSRGNYRYPPVSSTFQQRKELCDTLFCFAREIPGMARDCGYVLREGRANNDWDQCVAELLTQVLIGLYCGEGDHRLDGLAKYLMSVGVSC